MNLKGTEDKREKEKSERVCFKKILCIALVVEKCKNCQNGKPWKQKTQYPKYKPPTSKECG